MVLAIVLLSLSGCATRSVYDRKYVSDEIEKRSGYNIPVEPSDSTRIPPGIIPEDGLTQKEAVAIAVWNNPQLRVDLADLGFARADLIEAGMLPNPVFSVLFPLGPKQLEYTLSFAVDVLWQRPRRVASANLNAEKVAENLVNNGLALVRNVHVSFADLNLAIEKLKIMEDEADLDEEIAEIASIRMQAGDISELEETSFRLAASRTREASITARRDAEIQKIRFLTLLGLISEYSDLQINPDPVSITDTLDPEFLIETGLACRPDLRAAELEIEIAGERLGWERSKIINLTALLDANAEGKNGFEMGPGMDFEIPLFYFNQGGTARARAEIQRAADNYLVMQQSIRAEILEAFQSYRSAKQSYEFLEDEILTQAEQAAKNAEQAYISGEISYLEFLEFRRQLLKTRLRIIESEAEVRKNTASIYYTIGGNMIPL
jgi:cobalt-zinc-cadmium efflux system outer membrane protein